jgi:uncharacterized RDD family membrane protein YckC
MADELKPGMVQCEITGQWLPEDEVVTIQGMRVGSEGKQILLDKLKSGASLPGELEVASGWNRFGAMVVDNLVIMAITIPLKVGVTLAVNGGTMQTTGSGAAAAEGLVNIVTIALAMAYFTLMHARRGQTLGKIVAKIKVVRDNGSPIDFRMSLIRSVGYQGPALLGAFITGIAIGPGMIMVAGAGVIISVLSGLYVFVSAIMALMDKSKQLTIHDRIAGTRVIRVAQ